ncbi:DsrE family protein [Cyclobacterium xiamenense]|uniref:DsrE family protein n=1 Tax=Cyclobacterium xiamenense TaxID=1297121 RepID=UPI0035D0D339
MTKTDYNDNLFCKQVNKNKKGKKMKNGLILLVAAILISSCNQATTDNNGIAQEVGPSQIVEESRDGVFIHITESYNDPHKVLMPMKMAVMMAEDKDVLVYMDINAVELLVKDANDLTHEDFETFQTYLKILLENEVGVYACPTCLKVAGFNPEDLLEGVQTAQKDKFFNFTKGRIITLDY